MIVNCFQLLEREMCGNTVFKRFRCFPPFNWLNTQTAGVVIIAFRKKKKWKVNQTFWYKCLVLFLFFGWRKHLVGESFRLFWAEILFLFHHQHSVFPPFSAHAFVIVMIQLVTLKWTREMASDGIFARQGIFGKPVFLLSFHTISCFHLIHTQQSASL